MGAERLVFALDVGMLYFVCRCMPTARRPSRDGGCVTSEELARRDDEERIAPFGRDGQPEGPAVCLSF
jgi:hypothetical protein